VDELAGRANDGGVERDAGIVVGAAGPSRSISSAKAARSRRA
jgi:hypothetical protein